MAAESATTTEFGRVSRIKDVAFRYVTFFASVAGLVALGILLAYVGWDAFGLGAAEPAWYAAFAAFVVGPTLGVVLGARRYPAIGDVTLALVTTAVGGVLGGFALVAVLEIIVGPAVWFAYVATVAAPMVALALLGRWRSEVRWTGPATIVVAVLGSVVGTLALAPLSTLGQSLGDLTIYLLTVVVPAAFVVRYVVEEYIDLEGGDVAATALLIAAATGVVGAGFVPVVTPTIWLLFLVSLGVPLAIVLGTIVRDRDRWIGLLGPGALVVGVALLVVVPDALGITGPDPWFDWQYVTSAPSRFAEEAGLYSAIIGSVFVIVLVALLTLFVGVGAAIYLEEYAPSGGLGGKIGRLIRINIANLAGVPSVVYGILGLAVFANLVGLGYGTVVTAALTLSLLILPIVIIAAREAIDAVPDSMRQASYGLGATRWQTTRRVVIPRAMPGILTGTILALGRAIGETAPLIMIGVAHTKFSPPGGLFEKTTAMPMQIFAWSSYPSREFQHGVVAAGVVTLLVVLLTMNAIAILLRSRLQAQGH